MRGLFLSFPACVLVFAVFGAVPDARGEESTVLTGRDWVRMSMSDRLIYTETGLEHYRARGIPVEGTPEDYALVISTMLIQDPTLVDDELRTLFFFAAYSGNPDARPALDRILAASSSAAAPVP
jgi:hypothetical protein